MTTHLVLISDQAIPNLTPVLDQRYRPQRVVMLVSKDMQARSQALERVYRPRGIQVERCEIQDPWDIERCRQQVEDWLIEQDDMDGVVLNVTGGTKPLAIAAYEVFRNNDLPIFYVHPERDRLIWMHPAGETVDLADRIRLPDYLTAYGAIQVEIKHPFGVPESLRHLTGQLISKISYFEPAISRLNFVAASAGNAQLKSVPLTDEIQNTPAFAELVALFQDAGVLRQEQDVLIFKDEDARFFANGGWLEQHVYAAVLNLKSSLAIQDVSCSIEVSRQGQTWVRNELDVAFLKDNRLYLIECKTKRYAGNGQKHSEADDVLYKLDSIRDVIGGLKAQAMLVSVKKISQAQLSRAKELNIRVCCHEDIQRLQKKLRHWLE